MSEEFDVNQNTFPVNIEEEMKKDYIDYAMSVIVGRALPDVRDGLKPVHRRILYSMYENGITFDKAHKKSARIVGDVLGKYHPHGDSSVYDALVRMAQDFSIRYPLIDGHGNFGSIDGDSAAAMRYTEVRLQKIALEMMADINKDTVDFVPNYDESEKEPAVLPAKIPTLLVNGSSGIAVGMATNIPPHNLKEVINGLTALLDDPEITVQQLMEHIKGPDFPTYGSILGKSGILEAYTTGRGTVRMRGKAHMEEMSGNKTRIVITEIPYQVNKKTLIENIADLVRDKRIDGITDLRDESDRNGMRLVIELRKDVVPQVILNQLYKHTQLQESFGIIMLALVGGEPKILTLKQILEEYVKHQINVVTRRCQFDLKKAKERKEIVEGLKIALDNIDEVIRIIKSSRDKTIAKTALCNAFAFSDRQAQHILEMQLQRLTGLEREKIEEELAQLLKTIAWLEEVLGDESLIIGIIKDELLRMKDKYGDDRRTVIEADARDFDIEDLIAEEDAVITVTASGYIKRLNPNVYRSQRRGGKGVMAMTTKTEDFLESLFIASTHDYLMVFTEKGRVYRLKVHEIPESSRTSKGTAIINLINLSGEDRVKTVFPIKDYDEDRYLLMVTLKGLVKKTPLKEYDSNRKDGILGISLNEGDGLLGVRLIEKGDEIMLSTKRGYSIRFKEDEVRKVSRVSKGVRGIRLAPDDILVSMDVINPEEIDNRYVLCVSEKGYGKRTKLSEYSIVHRDGKGIYTLKVTAKTGLVAAIRVVSEDQQVMFISREGIIIRTKVAEIPVIGRNTQGVTIMKVANEDFVKSMAIVVNESEEPAELVDATEDSLLDEN
ncbi:MAG TPA: DNA gyrase subunit A [Clostridiales bacterium]|nr:DNA gyrase subunit A [Clostridiales bacterium]